jgi:hypothetical protein
MPTGKPAIRVFYKSAGKAVDPPIRIPVKKQNYIDCKIPGVDRAQEPIREKSPVSIRLRRQGHDCLKSNPKLSNWQKF